MSVRSTVDPSLRTAQTDAMRVLTAFARPGYRISEPLFLPDGEFLPEGTPLTIEHINMVRISGQKVILVADDCGARDWERLPEINTFMTAIQARFHAQDVHPGTDMIRCAVEDVFSRFIFEVDSETSSDGA